MNWINSRCAFWSEIVAISLKFKQMFYYCKIQVMKNIDVVFTKRDTFRAYWTWKTSFSRYCNNGTFAFRFTSFKIKTKNDEILLLQGT